MACEFDLGPEPILNGVPKWFEKYPNEANGHHIYVKNTGRGWAITQGNNCLRKDGKWEYSGMPSNRDEEFYESHRYISADQAINYYRKWKDVIYKWVEKIKENPPENWRKFKNGELVFEYDDCNEEELKFVY